MQEEVLLLIWLHELDNKLSIGPGGEVYFSPFGKLESFVGEVLLLSVIEPCVQCCIHQL